MPTNLKICPPTMNETNILAPLTAQESTITMGSLKTSIQVQQIFYFKYNSKKIISSNAKCHQIGSSNGYTIPNFYSLPYTSICIY